jgi:hypothetical protein
VSRAHQAPRVYVASTSARCLLALPQETYPIKPSHCGYCMPSALRLTSKVKVERRSAKSSGRPRTCRLGMSGTMQQQQSSVQRFQDPASEVVHIDIGVCPHLREKICSSISANVLLIVLCLESVMCRRLGSKAGHRWPLGAVKGEGVRRESLLAVKVFATDEPALCFGHARGAGDCRWSKIQRISGRGNGGLRQGERMVTMSATM